MSTRVFDSTWHEMVRLYADARVAELCLLLQDEFDVDVPVLLFFILADRDGIGCEEKALGRFLIEMAGWRECVVRPLRTIRRAMKKHAMSAGESALREDIKRIELQAEKLHVARLVAAFPGGSNRMGGLTQRYLTDRSLPEDRCRAAIVLLKDALADITATGDPDLEPPYRNRTGKTTAS